MKIINEALKWVGYLEKKSNSQLDNFTANAGSNNYTIFNRDYMTYWGGSWQAQPWCAMFVSVIFRQAFGADIQSKIMPAFTYCPTGVNQFKKLGCWHTSNPKTGDVIFFKNSTGVACHVGIVEKVENNKVYTIEGNTSSASGVVANGGAVAKKSYAISYGSILGYGRPDYSKCEDKMEGEEMQDYLVRKYQYCDSNIPLGLCNELGEAIDMGIVSYGDNGFDPILSEQDIRTLVWIKRGVKKG